MVDYGPKKPRLGFLNLKGENSPPWMGRGWGGGGEIISVRRRHIFAILPHLSPGGGFSY
jgi:hypothetical protein